jgi:hypothetical protein
LSPLPFCHLIVACRRCHRCHFILLIVAITFIDIIAIVSIYLSLSQLPLLLSRHSILAVVVDCCVVVFWADDHQACHRLTDASIETRSLARCLG